MSLRDIKDKLYNKGQENPEPGSLRYERDMEESFKNQSEDAWEAPKKELSERMKKLIRIGAIALGSLIFLALVIWGVYKFRQTSFSSDRVSVSVSGPTEIGSGKDLNCEISWKNDNRADLENAVLKISYPENFKPGNINGFESQSPTGGIIKLGEIPGHAGAKIMFSGRSYSPKGSLIYIQAEISYTPSNLSSQFVSQNRLSVAINSSPITFDIVYPQAVSNGDEVNYIIKYENTGGESFSNVSIKAEYPGGFEFISSNPPSSVENNIWEIGDLPAGKDGQLSISGKLSGERNEVKNTKIYIGSYANGGYSVFNEVDAGTKISASPLFISQSINKENKNLTANAGDFLNFEVFFRNDGDISFRNVIVSEQLEGEALDFSSLNLDMAGGSYDSGTRTVIWKASDYKILEKLDPGQSGRIAFNVKLKSALPIKTEKDKNFVISSLAKIDSPDVPTPIEMNKIISSNSVNIKVNSQLGLDTKGYYNDPVIGNSGPIPPKVDEETTYTIHWRILNASNNLTNAKVEAVLPTGVSMTGKKNPEGENISYNERTNLVVWEIGNLEAGVGVIRPAREVAFQVKIKPSIDKIGKVPDILGKSVFLGRDVFTLQNLKTESLGKNAMLLEDKSIGTSGGKVVN